MALAQAVMSQLDMWTYTQQPPTPRRSTFAEVRGLVEREHYSGGMPSGQSICYAWGDYAVAVYGVGANPYQAPYLARVTGLDVTPHNLVDLKRVAREVVPKKNWYLSSFLAWCRRDLAERGIHWVVSFSDPEQGHTGGLYRACGYYDIGTTKAEWHCEDATGHRVHRRVPYRHAKRHGLTMPEARAAMGLARVKTLPRTRWFIATTPSGRRKARKKLQANKK